MKLEWKFFIKSFPLICTKCGKLANIAREFCEYCGEEDSLRETTKEDHLKFQEE